MPAGGGTTQTAVNRLAGARTQLAGLVAAAGALVTMLLLAPFIGLMPEATLAAVVIVYSISLIKPVEFRTILNVRRTEFVWALAALVGVVLLGTLQGILVAIVVSLLALAHQVADPPVHVLGRKPGTNVFRPRSAEHPEDETFPGLLLLRPEGRIFFANVERVLWLRPANGEVLCLRCKVLPEGGRMLTYANVTGAEVHNDGEVYVLSKSDGMIRQVVGATVK